MNRLRMLAFVAATAAASMLAVSSPATAASSAKVAGSIRPTARSCSAPRVAHFRIALRHLRIGKEYLVEWTAPTRSAGKEVTQIAIIPTTGRYVVPEQKSRAVTPLLRRQFKTTITLSAVRKSGQKVDVMRTVTSVPACTRR